PSKKITQSGVIADYVKMPETACSAPDTCEQAQYELYRLISSIGTLDRDTAFLQLIFKMAFLKHLQKK
ncbi:MAG: hypothetical protein IKR89_07515, partial [Bacteroidaceae bacterium]|nr:hypothetical protein [Bacteroidaceae bacterium]